MKSLDVVVLCKLFSFQESATKWTYAQLAKGTGLSVGEVHASVKRLILARLFDYYTKSVIVPNMEELLIHGVKYVFSVQLGRQARGIPTSHSAPIFTGEILQPESDIYVWAHANGKVRGQIIKPLSDSAPKAAMQDSLLYDLLALIDALRIGRARERKIAEVKLKLIFGRVRKNVQV